MGQIGDVDCPVFDGVYEYCQVRTPKLARSLQGAHSKQGNPGARCEAGVARLALGTLALHNPVLPCTGLPCMAG